MLHHYVPLPKDTMHKNAPDYCRLLPQNINCEIVLIAVLNFHSQKSYAPHPKCSCINISDAPQALSKTKLTKPDNVLHAG